MARPSCALCGSFLAFRDPVRCRKCGTVWGSTADRLESPEGRALEAESRVIPSTNMQRALRRQERSQCQKKS